MHLKNHLAKVETLEAKAEKAVAVAKNHKDSRQQAIIEEEERHTKTMQAIQEDPDLMDNNEHKIMAEAKMEIEKQSKRLEEEVKRWAITLLRMEAMCKTSQNCNVPHPPMSYRTSTMQQYCRSTSSATRH